MSHVFEAHPGYPARGVVRMLLPDGVAITMTEKDARTHAHGRTWRMINGFVGTNWNHTTQYLARLIAGIPPGERLRFRDGDPTNLLPENLYRAACPRLKRP